MNGNVLEQQSAWLLRQIKLWGVSRERLSHRISSMSSALAFTVLPTPGSVGGAHSQLQIRMIIETDRSLVAALCRGEPGAAEAMYRKVSPAVNRALRSVLQGQNRDQDDLVQSTFERLIRTLIEGRFAFGCSLNTWAASIATHTGLDHLRARTRERKVFACSTDDSPPLATDLHAGERTIRARAEFREVLSILSRMKPEQAEALLLYYVDGLSVAEMAKRLDLSETAAQARLARGRKELLRRTSARLGRVASTSEQSDGSDVTRGCCRRR